MTDSDNVNVAITDGLGVRAMINAAQEVHLLLDKRSLMVDVAYIDGVPVAVIKIKSAAKARGLSRFGATTEINPRIVDFLVDGD